MFQEVSCGFFDRLQRIEMDEKLEFPKLAVPWGILTYFKSRACILITLSSAPVHTPPQLALIIKCHQNNRWQTLPGDKHSAANQSVRFDMPSSKQDMSSEQEAEHIGRELSSELSKSPVAGRELSSELIESPAGDRELSSELAESPIDPVFLRMLPPSKDSKDFHLQVNGEALWRWRQLSIEGIFEALQKNLSGIGYSLSGSSWYEVTKQQYPLLVISCTHPRKFHTNLETSKRCFPYLCATAYVLPASSWARTTPSHA